MMVEPVSVAAVADVADPSVVAVLSNGGIVGVKGVSVEISTVVMAAVVSVVIMSVVVLVSSVVLVSVVEVSTVVLVSWVVDVS